MKQLHRGQRRGLQQGTQLGAHLLWEREKNDARQDLNGEDKHKEERELITVREQISTLHFHLYSTSASALAASTLFTSGPAAVKLPTLLYPDLNSPPSYRELLLLPPVSSRSGDLEKSYESL